MKETIDVLVVYWSIHKNLKLPKHSQSNDHVNLVRTDKQNYVLKYVVKDCGNWKNGIWKFKSLRE